MKKKPELLAPAGTLDGLKTAIIYGADAVYAGIPGFSMRARAKITVPEMAQGIEFAHKHGKKVYLAFNLFAHDFDYDMLPRVSQVIDELQPDAPILVLWHGFVNIIQKCPFIFQPRQIFVQPKQSNSGKMQGLRCACLHVR